jgi:penicillin-binding protein 2
MPRSARIKDHQYEQHFFLQRTFVAAFVIAALTLVLLGRLVLLQIVRYDHYLDLAQGNRARKVPIPAPRGLILDRNGNVLAENQTSFQLELTREQVELVGDLETTLNGLVAIKVLSSEELPDVRRMIRARRSFEAVPIRMRLTEEQMFSFATRQHEFPGVEIQTRSARSYPHGALAVHALGYVSAINENDLTRIDRSAYVGTNLIGKLGVEAAREAELHGVNGFEEKLVNAQGRSVLKQGALLESSLRNQPATAGSELILSIDLAAQQAAEKAFGNRRGAAIAIDPHNGDVLVLASMPGFDPGMFGRGITSKEYDALAKDPARPLTNRALSGTYPAGSTIKPVLGMAGLAYGEIDGQHTHYCPGTFSLRGVSKPWREGRGGTHGTVDVRTAIAESCDVYFYWLANELGVDKMHDFLSPFGYGRKTGIDISGEAAGVLPSKAYKKARKDLPDGNWYPGDTINFGIGQGFMLVTPLQIAQVTAVLAAKGAVFQPRLVTGIRDPSTGKTKIIEPVAMPHVKGGTPEQWDVVMEGMRATVTRGTARGIQSKDYSIAGKTGTAQAYSVKANQRLDRQVEEHLRDHSWFMAFAPAEDPKIAVAVLVENGGFGASGAAPIVRAIMDAYLLPLLKQGAAEAGASPAAPVAESAELPDAKQEPEPGGQEGEPETEPAPAPDPVEAAPR